MVLRFLFGASFFTICSLGFEVATHKNYRLINGVFKTLHGCDWLTCIQACEATARCRSYNYKKASASRDTALCELNDIGLQKMCGQPEKHLIYDETFVFQQLRHQDANCRRPVGLGKLKAGCKETILQSCYHHRRNGADASGIYQIQDTNGTVLFSAYCDFTSEPNITWTLVQSYSLAHNHMFTAQHMSYNFPVNEESPVEWSQYRLSRANMQRVADQSTHVRFTCNFDSEGLVYTDYARAKLAGFHIFGMWYGQCRLYQRLNIRGVECNSCTAASYQRGGTMFHVGTGSTGGCQFDATAGAVQHEQSFGRYNFRNPKFRCVSGSESTTQTWFGIETNE